MLNSLLNLVLLTCGSTLLTGAAVIAIGKVLLKSLRKTLEAYATSYAQQKASIDARIANLEKLTEEQARLTRTIESIKDEIAAEAKSRDDRWGFKKEVYTNLINTTTDMISLLAGYFHLDLSLEEQDAPPEVIETELTQALSEDGEALDTLVAAFERYAHLAPLATADSVTPLVLASADQLSESFNAPNAVVLAKLLANFIALRRSLQTAGRKDLWGCVESTPMLGENASVRLQGAEGGLYEPLCRPSTEM